jgi:hypothetical protein
MPTDPNRIYITPVATYDATPPQIGINESHPVKDERKDMYQWIANNIVYLYARTSTVTLTANADGFSIAGGTTPRTLVLTGGSLSVTAPAANATLVLAGNFATTGAGKITLAGSGVDVVHTLPTGNSNIVGATGGVLSCVAAAAGSTLTLANNVEFSGAFKPKFISGANVDITLPVVNASLASTDNITGKKGVVRLDPANWVSVTDGAPLAAYAADDAGTVGLWSDGTKCQGLRWNNTAAATATVAQSFPVPTDCDITANPTLYVRCAKTGATAADTPTLISTMYAQTDGALYDAGADLGASTPALDNLPAKTLQLKSANLGLFPSLASSMTITLNPEAT